MLHQSDDTVIGLVVIDPDSRFGKIEVSYQLLPEHWSHGYGREAVVAATGWALNTFAAAPEVIAVTQEANTRSRRLLESIGMTPVSRFIEWDAAQVMYSVSRTDPKA